MFIRIKDTIINADTIKTITTGLFDHCIFIEFKDGTTEEYHFESRWQMDFAFDRLTLNMCGCTYDPVEENTDD